MLKWIEQAVQHDAQLLVFPEYGAMELTGLGDAPPLKTTTLQISALETLRKPFIEFFKSEASRRGIAILAPSMFAMDTRFRWPINRAYFFFPNGAVECQDKEHMTRLEEEVLGIGSGGSKYKVFDAFGVRFGINLCFDVEFPFAAHKLAREGVQVLLAPSCTETVAGLNRVHIGARARALENQFYVLVSQTVGEARWSLPVKNTCGRAAVYSTCDIGFPDDGIVAQGEINRPQWLHCELDISLIERVRSNGQVFNYKRMLEHQDF
jgi:predicted amidohydrolase